MSSQTMLELTCDITGSHTPRVVASWDEASRLGWTQVPAGVYRCPDCKPAWHVPEQRALPAPHPAPAEEDVLPVDIAGKVSESWPLVERAQQGDTEAFGQIYDRYADQIFRFVHFRVGNRPLAEDIVSDTFLRALKRISSFTWQGRDVGAWLITIARNLVADHFKSGRYRLEVVTGDVLDADERDRSPEGNPADAVVDHFTNKALLEAVKQLNPEQQEVVVLRYLQGHSVIETAALMGKNEGAIKALTYRAVRALARALYTDPSFEAPPIPWTAKLMPGGELDTSDKEVLAWARAHHQIAPSFREISPRLRARYVEAMTGRSGVGL